MMKKILLTVLSLSAIAVFGITPKTTATTDVQAEEKIITECKSAYCMDAYSGTPVYEKEKSKRLPIASMCKIMTLILTFDALESGKFDYDAQVPVSEHAMSMGGSQVYLEAGESYPVERLIESVVVCSANDSCVALAEYVAGSDSVFVDRRKKKAKELGCNDTLFSNCTGLPKDPQYSCAYDVAQMFRELISHEKFFEFSTLRTDEFPHPGGRKTLITNTNKMVNRYDGCDGGKTGFTNEAGFCLAATAKRGDMRLISVCIGAETGEKRFQAIGNMFDYTFANYQTEKIVSSDQVIDEKCVLKDGRKKYLTARPEKDVFAFYPVGKKPQYEQKISFRSVKAPVKKGDSLGELTVYLGGVEYAKRNLLCNEDADRATYPDYLRETAKKW